MCGSELSSFLSVTSGVPQGSVLGPILFLIFINLLPSVIVNSCVRLFADDAKIFNCTSSEAGFQGFCDDLDKLAKWAKDWQLSISFKKCQVLHLGSGNPKRNISLDGHLLPPVEQIKDLGILVDKGLKFTVHIGNIVSKAYNSINMVFRAFLNRQTDRQT